MSYKETDFTILITVAKKMMPTMKQMYKLRRVEFPVSLLETRFIQVSGNQGISSATAKMTVAVNMIVTIVAVTHKPTVLFNHKNKYYIFRSFLNRI